MTRWKTTDENDWWNMSNFILPRAWFLHLLVIIVNFTFDINSKCHVNAMLIHSGTCVYGRNILPIHTLLWCILWIMRHAQVTDVSVSQRVQLNYCNNFTNGSNYSSQRENVICGDCAEALLLRVSVNSRENTTDGLICSCIVYLTGSKSTSEFLSLQGKRRKY